MKTHNKKLIISYFRDVWNGYKQFELRKNDCNYAVGDELILLEYNSITKKYTGKVIRAEIIYVLEGFKGLENGYCILGIKILSKENSKQ